MINALIFKDTSKIIFKILFSIRIEKFQYFDNFITEQLEYMADLKFDDLESSQDLQYWSLFSYSRGRKEWLEEWD